MPKKKLDRSRVFGTVQGGDSGAAFVQDEILFDAAGDEIVAVVEAPVVAAPVAADKPTTATRRGKAKTATEVLDTAGQVAANLSQNTTTETVVEAPAAPAPVADTPAADASTPEAPVAGATATTEAPVAGATATTEAPVAGATATTEVKLEGAASDFAA